MRTFHASRTATLNSNDL